MIRLFLVTACLIICYNSGESGKYITRELLNDNSLTSLYLCVGVWVAWPDRRVLAIIAIEIFLIACNFYTRYNLDSETGGILNGHYGQLQFAAFCLELLVMFSFLIIEWKKPRDDNRSHIYSDVFSRRINNRRGNSN